MILDLIAVCSNAGMEEDKDVHIDMDTFSSQLGVFPIIKKEPFMLHLSNIENKRLLMQGTADVTFSVPCDRCLADVPVTLHLVIDKELPLEKDGATSQDHLGQAEYMDGYQLDVDQLVYGEILLAWPTKVLCKESCKGICSHCGANRNETSCGCLQVAPDPRMAAFQDVFNKFKEV